MGAAVVGAAVVGAAVVGAAVVGAAVVGAAVVGADAGTNSGFNTSPLATFTSWLQPLEQTRLFFGSASPRGTHTGVQSSEWRTHTPSSDSVFIT